MWVATAVVCVETQPFSLTAFLASDVQSDAAGEGKELGQVQSRGGRPDERAGWSVRRGEAVDEDREKWFEALRFCWNIARFFLFASSYFGLDELLWSCALSHFFTIQP